MHQADATGPAHPTVAPEPRLLAVCPPMEAETAGAPATAPFPPCAALTSLPTFKERRSQTRGGGAEQSGVHMPFLHCHCVEHLKADPEENWLLWGWRTQAYSLVLGSAELEHLRSTGLPLRPSCQLGSRAKGMERAVPACFSCCHEQTCRLSQQPQYSQQSWGL